ncbi:MAG TPA: sugar phosphate isomerase/epimerase [Gemmataceae bacterium]|nr:sugar phosphate isomerase/epimerase [Gemmataceae bacterium]
MYVACSSLCFGRYPLAQALHTISELNFHKVDLALHESGPHVKPSQVLADVNKVAQVLRKANVTYAAFHVEIEAADADQYKERLRAVCRLGRVLAVPLVNIPAAAVGSDFNVEVSRLTGLTRLAESEGVMLTVETHSRTITADPARAAELCRQVPGLGLTLDPSHYLVAGPPGPDYDDLYPFVRHVRLRDTAPARLQVRVGQGQVEYGKIISQLSRERYERALSVDIHDTPDAGYAMDAEVRKLKYLLESMV